MQKCDSHGKIIKNKWELMITDGDNLHAIALWLCMALQKDVNGQKKQKKKTRSLPTESAV